ncbi:BSD domain-containing protein [Ditylenchus destructor]|nr:BSD domain-containing protein [Ditylenchus destructor]
MYGHPSHTIQLHTQTSWLIPSSSASRNRACPDNDQLLNCTDMAEPVKSNLEAEVKDVPEASKDQTAEDAKSPGESEAQSPSWLSGANAWGTSFLQSAKDKTFSTFESMKKDLNEFSDTVQHEASVLASATATQVKQQAQLFQQFVKTPDGEDEKPLDEQNAEGDAESKKEKKDSDVAKESDQSSAGSFFPKVDPSKWVKSIVDTVQKLGIEDTTKDESNYTEEIKVGIARRTNLDQCQLLQLQNDEKTFLQGPTQNVDLYNEWLQDFKIGEYNGEINLLLTNNPKLREIYSKLVPSQVDNHTFWNRYFFKVHVFELDKSLTDNCAQEKKESPEGSSQSGVEKDETWSMCSSAKDLDDLDEEFDSEGAHPEPVDRQETLTPRLEEDGWEKCDPK